MIVFRNASVFAATLFLMMGLGIQSVNAQSILTWDIKASMINSRQSFALVSIDMGKLYAIGGVNHSGFTSEILAIVEEYDPVTNTWMVKSPMPTARYNVAGVSSGDRVYVIGGYNGSFPVATVEEYDPIIDTWIPKADMPSPRHSSAAVTADNGRVYVAGGFSETGSGTILATFEEYDPVSDTWTTKADMPTPRYGLGLVKASNGKVYAIGGSGPDYLSVVEEYNPITDSWATKTGMPTPRTGLAVTSVGGHIYAIGGYNGCSGYLTTVEEYDPSGNIWNVVDSISVGRSGLGVASTEGRIYAVGGTGPTTTSSELSVVESATISTHNNPPTVDAGGSYQVDEGGGVIVNAEGDDPENGSLTYAWDLDQNGSFEMLGQSVIFDASAFDGPGVKKLMVQVTDDGGETSTDEAVVNIVNIAPIVGAIVIPPNPPLVGNQINVSSSFVDVGIPDTHTAIWNWGDGVQTMGTVDQVNNTVTGNHVYSTPGEYEIKLIVTDDDSGLGESSSVITVTNNSSSPKICHSRKNDWPTSRNQHRPTHHLKNHHR